MRAAAVSLCISLMIISLWFMDLGYAKIDPETCIGLWLFDEGEGDIAKDSSLNGNDGEFVQNPKWVDGKLGKALEFDGAGSHVAVGDFAGYSDNVTIVALIKTSEASGWNDIIVGPCGDVIFALKDSKLNFAGQCANPIPHNTWSKTSLDDNKWHHVAGTYDGKEVSVYVDGELEASNPAGGSFTIGEKHIGSRDDGQEAYNDLIDEVAIFNVALSADDIKAIAKSGLAVALGMAAVSPTGKIAATWGSIKGQ
ncbi:MAG: LamG domain-containing protein [bacterium]